MIIEDCGWDYPHEKGEFGHRRKEDRYYFISHFTTPFVYEQNNRLYFGNEGEFLVHPPGSVVYHGPQSKDEAFHNDWIFVGGEDFDALMKKYPIPLLQPFYIDNAYFFKSALQKIKKELLLKRTGYQDIVNARVTEFLITLHRLHQQQHLTDSSVLRIETARETVLQNLGRKWTLQEMAALSGYSVSRFSSLYVQQFGLAPKADLIDNRVQQAKHFLKYSNRSVTEISSACGFQSIYYFSKYFKGATGMSPSEYVKQWRSTT